MEANLDLNAKCLQVKSEITEGINKTPMARLFNIIGSFVRKITRSPKQLPLAYCVVILSLLMLLITFALPTYPIRDWSSVLRVVIFGQVGLLSIILTYFNIKGVLTGIRDTVVDYLVSDQSLADLQEWLYLGWMPKVIRRFLVIYGGCFGVVSLYFFSVIGDQFSKIGSVIFSLVFGILGGISWYYVPLMLLLPIKLRAYQFKLFENDPVRSEIVDSMSTVLNRFTYGYVSISAIVQLSLAALKLPIFTTIIFMVIIGWLPVTIQFVLNQVSIRNIVSVSKKKTLNRIQEQISTLHAGDITNKEAIETINHLMDYHERIRKTPNSNLDLEGVLNFLNQLALPLLGFLIGNIDVIIKFFAKP